VSARLAAVLVAVAACTALPAAAQAQEAAAPAADASPLIMDVHIQRFGLEGHQLTAAGTATIGLTDGSGATTTTSRSVVFAATAGASCRVLNLKLDTLQLTLLGLRVDTSQINLVISGQARGGALGQLFCKLARGLKLPSLLRARATARSLNRAIAHHPLRPIGFSASIRPSTEPAVATAAQAAPAPGSCQVLDLVLGPLNLNLLGLQVDLYGADASKPVRVLITADPNGGVLGQVFCRLASGQAAT
jgi:hypothetical protein